jgi:hypothetical protein
MVITRLKFSNHPISLAKQNMLVQHNFPNFKFSWQNGFGTWRGALQPREISPVYNILIKYKIGFRPKVWVLKPEPKSNAPHRFSDKSLCLYWNKEWDWAYDTQIADTILPWTALWLYNYELWLDTGEWLAKEAPHSPT